MLDSRSTRLAACLLLALITGWTVRAQRKGTTTVIPSPAPTVTAPVNEPSKSAFPDE